jgi:protein TonB
MQVTLPFHPLKYVLFWLYASVRELFWWSLGLLVHLLLVLLILNHFYAPKPATAAPELIVETLELTLAEVESPISTDASTPEIVPAAQPVPQPDIAPYLMAPDSPIALSEFPPPTAEPLPKLSGLPIPELPLPALPDQLTDLPKIILPPPQLPPTQPSALPPQQASGATARIEQPELITDLSALQKSYPAIARRKGWEGTVTLRLTINAKGRLEKTEIIESSGYDVLDNEAVKMMRKARFRNGPGELIQSVSYSLDAQGSRLKR